MTLKFSKKSKTKKKNQKTKMKSKKNQKIKKSNKKNYKLKIKSKKGGMSLIKNAIFGTTSYTPEVYMSIKDPSLPKFFGGIAQIHKINGLEIYTTSNPPQSNEIAIQYSISNINEILSYFMKKISIKVLLSFQACEDPLRSINHTNTAFTSNHPNQCIGNPQSDENSKDYYDANIEKYTWNKIKETDEIYKNDDNIKYVSCLISDMTAGTLSSWMKMSSLPHNNPNKRIMAHCFAGFGRTGAFILSALMKDNFFTQNNDISFLNKKYLDVDNIVSCFQFHEYLKYTIMQHKIEGPEDYVTRIIDELFDIPDNLYKINLFIQRINNIIVSLWRLHRIRIGKNMNNEIYLFNLLTPEQFFENYVEGINQLTSIKPVHVSIEVNNLSALETYLN